MVWIDSKNKSIHPFAETKAWSWQQGSRLRWHPVLENTVLYNDFENGHYVMKSVDIDTGKSNILCRACYDIDSNVKYGLTLNFDRLQKLRPGYGYSCQKDNSINDPAPKNDGVFLVDINGNKEKLLYSIADLASDIHKEGVYHYINHLSVSPNGKRFMFFHLWTANAQSQWNMRFYVSNIDGTGLTMLEDDVRVSHYCWVDDDKLMATCRVKDKEFRHVIYDLKTRKKMVNQGKLIDKDGHPTVIYNGFITDTYPQKNMMQYVYLSSLKGEYNKEILELFADPACYGEHRCDLHPRVMYNKYITLDSTFMGGLRSIVAFELNDNEIGNICN